MTMLYGVFFPTPTDIHPRSVLLARGLMACLFARKTGDVLGNPGRGVVCHPIHRPWRWPVFPSRRITCPPWIAGPELSGWGLGRVLLSTVPGRQPAFPPEPMMAPGALHRCGRSFHNSSAAYASQTVSHVGAGVPYRRGRTTPAGHEGCQPALVCFRGGYRHC